SAEFMRLLNTRLIPCCQRRLDSLSGTKNGAKSVGVHGRAPLLAGLKREPEVQLRRPGGVDDRPEDQESRSTSPITRWSVEIGVVCDTENINVGLERTPAPQRDPVARAQVQQEQARTA